MHKRLSLVVVVVASSWLACSNEGRLPVGGDAVAESAQGSTVRDALGQKASVACLQEDIEVLTAAPDFGTFVVEASSTRNCIVGLASYARAGGGPAAQTLFADTGGGLLVPRAKTLLRVALPCGAWQADLYFNIGAAPSVPIFHGGNLVGGVTGATSCPIPPSPPPPVTCDPRCDGRDVCDNGVCVPPGPFPSPTPSPR